MYIILNLGSSVRIPSPSHSPAPITAAPSPPCSPRRMGFSDSLIVRACIVDALRAATRGIEPTPVEVCVSAHNRTIRHGCLFNCFLNAHHIYVG